MPWQMPHPWVWARDVDREWARAGGRGPFLAWPDRATWRAFAWTLSASAAWFALVFGGADAITARRALRVPVHLAFERDLPLVPGAVWIYMSVYALFALAPFVLRAPRAIVALGATHVAIVLVAGVGFLLVPAEIAWPVASLPAGGATAAVYRLADALNLDYNLLPSLHVALSVSCVAVYAPAGAGVRLLLWAWAVAVALSTVLTHFHHVLDAVTGFALGVAAVAVVYRRVAGAVRQAR
jgi:membrane-associated phospholipid phosphatase